MSSDVQTFDALLPPVMAEKAAQAGVRKAQAGFTSLFALGVLAGAFIAIGGMFSTVATAGAAGMLPYGVIRTIAGLAFGLGLIMVVVGGAELFTGNTLIVMAFASGKVSLTALLRNWAIVYASNFVGAVLTAGLVFVTGHYTAGQGSVGLNILAIGEAKTALAFVPALAMGILCNTLVCMAVWLCFSARTTTDKILAIMMPIAAFVAASFEHSIANMYFIPLALFVKDGAPSAFWELIQKTPADYPHLTWANFGANLVPVTIGNIIGGAVMVGLVYWLIYLSAKHRSDSTVPSASAAPAIVEKG
ncbi:MAG: formate transporter FocA [Anaerolineales bacterium]|nr:formate transporter FocA [Anaerolineales bacterium]